MYKFYTIWQITPNMAKLHQMSLNMNLFIQINKDQFNYLLKSWVNSELSPLYQNHHIFKRTYTAHFVANSYKFDM